MRLTFYDRKNEFYCIYSQLGGNNKYSVTFVQMPIYEEPIQIKLFSVIKFVQADYEGERLEMIRILTKNSNIFCEGISLRDVGSKAAP